ncbi:hypothetical protein GCM10023085_44470 [Actinomadura viridis]|uniref:DNA-directed RNA polymerase specialized sigma24 family protein n=1 Tax=Actinomadura viridis TaxID=58110 RepID=A0A931GK37_9ACTN|nr:hypothetical protein [Actinomadura viridis]MBG6089810.1 DNA-directed RNA polymerase specialized sigma24 family protein [Actinomadura viridis]
MDERAQRIHDAITEITQIEDPQVRAKAATEALKAIHEGNSTLAEARRDGVKELRAAGLSYRAIGPLIGVHFSRVKQLESGEPTGIHARPRKEKTGE